MADKNDARTMAQQLLARIQQAPENGGSGEAQPLAAALLERAQPTMALAPPHLDAQSVDTAPADLPPLREQYSREMFQTAGRAAGGLVGGEGAADLSGSVPLYREGGAEVSLPGPARVVGEYLGDALMAVSGAGGGSLGYFVGGLGDLMVNSGAMDRSQANRFVRDVMAMPEAFAGSPGQLMTAPRMAAPRVARAAEEAGAPARGAEGSAPLPRAGAPQAASQAAEMVADQDARIGELIRRGSGFGIGSRRAREELARLSQANPDARAAAERLGIELPVDVLTDTRQIREAVGATRAIAGTEASAAWKDDLIKITDRADEAIQELGGATDLSTVSNRVLTRLDSTRDNLFSRADRLYNSVDEAIPRNTMIEPSNVIRTLNEVIGELGGPNGMTSAEQRLFGLVTGDQPITYRRLMREKTQIGRAIRRGDGPYADVDQADLSRLYAALTEDQLENVGRVGGDDLRANLELANDLYAKGKEVDNEIASAFGSDRLGSIARQLRSAVGDATRGDISKLNRTLRVIPEDLRRESVASAIREIASSTQGGERGFGFSQLTNFYSSLRRNPQAYRLVRDALGPESESVLRDLYEISRRVTDARANISTTGRANQPLIAAMKAESLMGRLMNTTAGRRALQATTTGAGGVAGGLPGAMMGDAFGDMIARVQPDRMQRASRLFRSDGFKDLIEQMATQETVPIDKINRVANSRSFRQWAKSVGVEEPRTWLQGAILALSADQGEEGGEQ